MLGVQLDHNSDAKKLFKSCNAQGLVECFRLPHSLRVQQDDSILKYAIENHRLLLTYDRPIIDEWWQAIAGGSNGVVVIALDGNDPYTKTMTYAAASRIIAAFKADFPQWHSLCWDNSVVEISPSYVEVNHVVEGGVVRNENGYLGRSTSGWQLALQELLNKNASR